VKKLTEFNWGQLSAFFMVISGRMFFENNYALSIIFLIVGMSIIIFPKDFDK